MGKGGSKSKSTSNSYSGSGQQWAQPYAIGGVGQVNSVFNQAQPGLQKLTGTVQDDLVPSLLSKYKSGLGNVGSANAHVGDVLSGKFLNGNPFLDNIIGSAKNDIFDKNASIFSLAGRYGSDAHQEVLADEIGEMSSGLRYQNYATEMDRLGAAANAAQATSGADLGQLLSSIGIGAEIPYTGSSNLANSLGALFSGGTSTSTSTQKQGGGGFLGALGAIGAGLASNPTIFSDRRLKKDIVEVGTHRSGLTEYEWTYRNDPTETRYRGVMADEVKELRPEAYIPNYQGSGFDAVNYGAL